MNKEKTVTIYGKLWRRRSAVLSGFCVLLLCSCSSHAGSLPPRAPLRFAIVVQENTLIYRISQAMLAYISRQIKIPITLEYLPSKRALKMFELGEIDAEVSRVESYLQLAPYAVRVEEPVAQFPIYAYAIDKNILVDGWLSLLPYRVLIVNGWLYTQEKISLDSAKVVDSPIQAFNALKAGRADVFAIGYYAAKGILDSPDFDRKNIIRLEPAVTVMHTYTYFHKRHAGLVKAYNQALKKMKRDGTYRRILLETR